MLIHRFARMFALGNFAVGTAVLLSATILLQSPETSFAQTANTSATSAQTSTCVAPTFYSFSITPASLNTPWNLPLLSTIDGPYAPTVTAKGLPTGIELQDQKTTLTAGGSTLHLWVLAGAPLQTGTYTITVTAQNSCGGTSSVITLPINTAPTAQGSVCPSGTFGTYPNCSTTNSFTTAFDKDSLVSTTSSPVVRGTSNTQNVSLTVQDNVGSTIYTSPSTAVSGGRWSVQLSNLVSGLYKLYLYSNNLLLIPGTLTVAVPSNGSTPTSQPGSSVSSATLTQATNVGSSAGECVQLPATTMQIGGKGTAVTALQNALIQRGFLAPGSATGYFGELTRAAVQKFQASVGIASSGNESTTGFGLVGARTRALLGCQGSTQTNTSPSTTVQQSVQRISCPSVPQPVCTNGSLISLGFDNNGCSLGKVCQQTVGQSQNASCRAVTNPTCTNGTLISYGTDAYGCSLGSYCQQHICYAVSQITSCPAGQTLVSGNDQYGCPNVSYCSGTPTPTPTSATLSASPSSGSAPLSVSFSPGGLTAGYTYYVDFGDGSSSGTIPGPCPTGTICLDSIAQAPAHTYTNSGSYSATLRVMTAPTGSTLFAGSVVANTTVTVNGSSAGASLVASTNFGYSYTPVTFTGTMPGTTYTLDFGDGSQPVISAMAIDCAIGYLNCAAGNIMQVNQTHTYTAPGTYTATLTGSNGQITTTKIVIMGLMF